MKIKKIIGLFIFTLLLTNCGKKTTQSITNPSQPNETLTIWWTRSYYAQEDEALEEIITAWQNKTGKKVDFSFISPDDILKKTVNALKDGNPPDIVYGDRADDSLTARWAWDGKLADVTDVVEPLKDVYSNAARQSVYLYNNTAQQRSTYAIPLKQQTIHIHYGREFLAAAGLREEDIPTEWNRFWAFWKQAQDNLRAKGREDIYSFGFPMSSEASDTHYIFEHILDAYDVQLLDEKGNLLLKNPQVRQGVIVALNWYTQLYKDGYVPNDADNWTNASNNTTFLNQNTVLTINPSLSIPGSQREDQEVYHNQIATIGFPSEPDGEQLKQIVTIKQVLLFESSANKEIAKDLLSYLIQPENISAYLEGSLGRYFPVMPIVADDPFWNNPADPHISTANQQFHNLTRSNYQSLNPAYTKVQSESVWGQAIERIIIEDVAVDEAADEALARIEEIFAQWDFTANGEHRN